MTTNVTTVEPTAFVVSLLPMTHPDYDSFAVWVERADRGVWSVYLHGLRLNGECRWVRPHPADISSRYRFDLDTALRLASEAAPRVRHNGVTAATVAARMAGGAV